MKLLDITQTYEAGMRHYPSIPDFQLEWVRHYDKGSGMALSRFTVTSHLGTHIDAPYHFLSNGARTIDLSLDALCGPAQVVDVRGVPRITRDVLAGCDIHTPRLIFLTDNTRLLKESDSVENVSFTPDACDYLRKAGVRLVGIDYFSVDPKGDKSRSAHLPLLSSGIIILEAVQLDGVVPGDYELWCLPLKIAEAEGAPCRAVLQTKEEFPV